MSVTTGVNVAASIASCYLRVDNIGDTVTARARLADPLGPSSEPLSASFASRPPGSFGLGFDPDFPTAPDLFGRHVTIRYSTALRGMARPNQSDHHASHVQQNSCGSAGYFDPTAIFLWLAEAKSAMASGRIQFGCWTQWRRLISKRIRLARLIGRP